MKVYYDAEADAMYIEIDEGTFSKNEKLDDTTILDLDQEGHLLGIEILDVSKRLSQNALSQLREKRIPTVG